MGHVTLKTLMTTTSPTLLKAISTRQALATITRLTITAITAITTLLTTLITLVTMWQVLVTVAVTRNATIRTKWKVGPRGRGFFFN
ncbi:hypothetical protein C8035_v006384 [Colletotrichum spinosum]|uniref:Uncharacterized protein n=1 Tax=Colletotrichum spinosum TaxID=1347390 RepID=A0A4R8PQG1_9PEZI|nr:hypothetical protein C8035_v006384 [Colletotrichum spinosum]